MANTNEYMREYMLTRYHERMELGKQLLGGKCVDCAVTEQLEFDHVDPALKTYTISKIWAMKWETVLAELEKCVLRCKACHLIKTRGEQSVGHGEGLTGKRNCRCELCAPLKRAYLREYRKKRASS